MSSLDTKTVAVAIALEAGALLREGYRQAKHINAKSSAIDLVTQYDTEAEALIVRRLSDAFPQDAILGEEGGDQNDSQNGSSRLWLIDPLDGTINFAHGYPAFAVSLALYDGNQALVGVVYDPLRDECFHAASDHGAFLTSADGEQRLQVSRTGELVASLLATGFPYDRHHSERDNVTQFTAFLKRARGIRRSGAAALDVAYVAAGRLDGYWEYKLGSWDIAAALLLLREAGGRASAMDGSPFTLQPWQHNALVASNGQIHEDMIRLLQSIPA